MVETIWDWMFLFYAAAALGVAALIFIRWARPKQPTYPKEWVCDCCGQVCTHLKDGLCVYCDRQFTNKK
jgi:predicted MFS family arabinose efflux permease